MLAGGATGLIGDPRDVGERAMNTADTVADWATAYGVNWSGSSTSTTRRRAPSSSTTSTWTSQLSAIDFLRDVGKHFSVNVMLDRDTIRRRLDGEGISYTEFSYMLLQANDYVELHQRHGCRLQIGGSDQWGNIIAGVRLVRQKLGATAHALTVPLVTTADGEKIGKSTGGGRVWLDPEMTSPYAWYQYFVNTADDDVIRYLRWFTFLTPDELAELEEATQHASARTCGAAAARSGTDHPGARAGCDGRRSNWPARRCSGEANWPAWTRRRWRRLARDRQWRWPSSAPGDPDAITDLLVASGLSPSKGAARRTVAEGGVYVNNGRITSEEWAPQPSDFLHGTLVGAARGQAEYRGCASALCNWYDEGWLSRKTPSIRRFDSQFSLM